ncbi:hypothetical protein MMC30_002283 [Trapelia coarctata]|nr:hypothetical protein [Trapelia coarctata]
MCFGSKPKVSKSQISAPRPIPHPQHTHAAPTYHRGPPSPPGPRNPPPTHGHPAYASHPQTKRPRPAHAAPAHAHPPRRLPPCPGPPPTRALPPLPLKTAGKKGRIHAAPPHIGQSAQICRVTEPARFQIHAEPVYASRAGVKVPMKNRMSNVASNNWEMF